MKKPEPKDPSEIDIQRVINLAKDMLQTYEERGVDYIEDDLQYTVEELMKEVFGKKVYDYINSLS